MTKKFLSLTACSLLFFTACEKQEITPVNTTDERIVSTVETDVLTIEEEESLADLQLEVDEAIRQFADEGDRGLLDVENPYNPYDFVGSGLIQAYKNVNMMQMSMDDGITQEAMDDFGAMAITEFGNLVPNAPDGNTSTPVNLFEWYIFKSYVNTAIDIQNRNLFIVVNKIYDSFIVNYVSNSDRRQRLLIFTSMQRYSGEYLRNESIVLSGVNLGDTYAGVSPFYQEVMNWTAEEANSWSSGEWFLWGLTYAVCQNELLLSCAYEVYTKG